MLFAIDGGHASTDRRWFHTDEGGSVVARSDNTGKILQVYAYGPDGEAQGNFGAPTHGRGPFAENI